MLSFLFSSSSQTFCQTVLLNNIKGCSMEIACNINITGVEFGTMVQTSRLPMSNPHSPCTFLWVMHSFGKNGKFHAFLNFFATSNFLSCPPPSLVHHRCPKSFWLLLFDVILNFVELNHHNFIGLLDVKLHAPVPLVWKVD